MTVEVMNRARVEWTPAIAGAFCALATGVVLFLFGEAFGQGGLRVLSGVWAVATPLVATFIGAAIAASMSHRLHAYATGLMVWCISVVAGAALMVSATSLATREPAGNTAPLALAGLAAILGLIGAVIGSSVGSSLTQRAESAAFTRGEASGMEASMATDPRSGVRPRPAPAESDQPQLRH